MAPYATTATPRNSLTRYGSAALHSATDFVRDTLKSLGASPRTIRASLPAALKAAPVASQPTPSPTSSTSLAAAQTASTAPTAPTAPPTSPPATSPAAPHFDGRRFRKTAGDAPITARAVVSLLWSVVSNAASGSRIGSPPAAVPIETPDIPSAAADLAATWLGHATVLLEVDGYRILADPMFGDRASPSNAVGPRRLHPAPIAADALPTLDAALISHDHYDHLDRPTIAALVASSPAPFLVPLGIGAHLRGWGVPADRIIELDWHESHQLGRLTITCTPARHFSGRGTVRNTTLWASWTVLGPAHRVFFGGDTGYTAAFADIGRDYGPFDLTVLPIGAYDPAWPDIHMTPEEALRAHRDLAGALLLPIHWATFNLARHGWSEPVERLLRGADGEAIAIPPPGRRIVPGTPPTREAWWRPPRADNRL